MTLEELRSDGDRGMQAALNHPFLVRLTADQRAAILAARHLLATDDAWAGKILAQMSRLEEKELEP